MTTYPASITCPSCGKTAANITEEAYPLLWLGKVNRFGLRTDAGRPGPSHRLVVCQACHYPFRATPRLIIHSPRTIEA